MATTILIIATSRSALFKIKRATRARSETRLPCRSSPFVSVLPVAGPQIPMNRSLPPRTTILFSRGLPKKRGVHKKRPTWLSALRALPARSAGRCARSGGWGKTPRAPKTPQWMGADPSQVTTLIGSITRHFAICDRISQIASYRQALSKLALWPNDQLSAECEHYTAVFYDHTLLKCCDLIFCKSTECGEP